MIESQYDKLGFYIENTNTHGILLSHIIDLQNEINKSWYKKIIYNENIFLILIFTVTFFYLYLFLYSISKL